MARSFAYVAGAAALVRPIVPGDRPEPEGPNRRFPALIDHQQ